MSPLASLLDASSMLTSPAGPSTAASTSPYGLSTCDAAALLNGMAGFNQQGGDACDPPEEEEGDGETTGGVSRKDKSLGLLCDNFVKLYASGASKAVELEGVASMLGVGRRRIYDIVNVLESLDVVQKDRTSAYTWLGITKLPECVERLKNAPPVVPLLLEDGSDIEGGGNDPLPSAELAGARRQSTDKMVEGRKEKSIRELSTKFVSLFLQATKRPSCDATISLDQAARSLLKHESGLGAAGPEPDPGAMKTKVRRLYDICNVLTSLRMITKVRLPDTSKPAFKWHGVTDETKVVFDPAFAATREIKAYGGGANLPVCSKRSRQSLEKEAKAEMRAIKRQSTAETTVLPAPAFKLRPGMAIAGAIPMHAMHHESGLPFSRLSGGAGGPVDPTAAHPIAAARVAATPVLITPAMPVQRPAAGQPALVAAVAPRAHVAAVAGPVAVATIAAAPAPSSSSVLAAAPPSRALGVLSPSSQQAATESPRILAKKRDATVAMPTPAHVQAELLVGLNGVPLENTPRAATSALLCLAATQSPEPVAVPCDLPVMCARVVVPEDVGAVHVPPMQPSVEV